MRGDGKSRLTSPVCPPSMTTEECQRWRDIFILGERKVVAGNLRRLGLIPGKSKKELADALGISVKTLSKLLAEEKVPDRILERVMDWLSEEDYWRMIRT